MAPNDQTVEARLDELTAKTESMEEELRGAILRIVEYLRQQEELIRQEQRLTSQRQRAIAEAEEAMRGLLG